MRLHPEPLLNHGPRHLNGKPQSDRLLVLYLFAGLLFSVLRSLKAIGAGAERLARGDLSRTIDSRSQDELRDVGTAVNTVIATLYTFTTAQLDMARAHNQDGSISATIDETQFSGAYRDIAHNLNEMAKAHIEVQTQFADLMVEYADGKFDSRMAKLPGEQQKISDAAEKVRAGLEAAAEASGQDAHVTAALVCEHP